MRHYTNYRTFLRRVGNMGTRTTRFCDKCKAEKSEQDLCYYSLDRDRSHKGGNPETQMQFELCVHCWKEMEGQICDLLQGKTASPAPADSEAVRYHRQYKYVLERMRGMPVPQQILEAAKHFLCHTLTVDDIAKFGDAVQLAERYHELRRTMGALVPNKEAGVTEHDIDVDRVSRAARFFGLFPEEEVADLLANERVAKSVRAAREAIHIAGDGCGTLQDVVDARVKIACDFFGLTPPLNDEEREFLDKQTAAKLRTTQAIIANYAKDAKTLEKADHAAIQQTLAACEFFGLLPHDTVIGLVRGDAAEGRYKEEIRIYRDTLKGIFNYDGSAQQIVAFVKTSAHKTLERCTITGEEKDVDPVD